MTLTSATYNILRGYNSDLIIANLRFLIAEGADVICLQEAEEPFEAKLRALLQEDAYRGWDAHFAHAGQNGHVATLWNAERLRFRTASTVILPKLKVLHSLRLKKLVERWNRLALIADFELADGRVVQVTNAYLSWEGGSSHRLRQLRLVRETIAKTPADFRVIAGDFNTVAPRPLRHLHERRVERILGEDFRNAFPKLPWTYDISVTHPSSGPQFIGTLSRAGVKWRQRLDYMFAKDLAVLSAQMHDLPGSDHRPLIATFGLPSTTASV